MRERLIELLNEWGNKENDGIRAESIADYLLGNGVIVMPCKTGDIVYETDGVRIYELRILDISLHKNRPYYKTESIDFDDNAIGKSIFLTRQEAETKLK